MERDYWDTVEIMPHKETFVKFDIQVHSLAL